MPEQGKLGPKVVSAAQRRALALELRRRGLSFRRIVAALREHAERYGWQLPAKYNERQAWVDVNRALKEFKAQLQGTASDVCALEVARIEAIIERLWDSAMAGDKDSMKMLLRAIDSMVRLKLQCLPPEERRMEIRQEVVYRVTRAGGGDGGIATAAPDAGDSSEDVGA